MNLPSLIPDSSEPTNNGDHIIDRSLKNYFDSFPAESFVRNVLANAFVINRPMSGVGGDGYWLHAADGCVFLVVFDCTGHGRLASIMTRVYLTAIQKSIEEEEHNGDPAELLLSIHEKVKEVFINRSNAIGSGADLILLKYDSNKREVSLSGAGMGLVFVQNKSVQRIKGHTRRIGDHFEIVRNYSTEKITLLRDQTISFFIFTDGLPDLIGGPKNKRFGYKNLEPLLSKAHELPVDKARELIESTIQNWKGFEDPLDDLLIIGFSI